MRLFIASLLCVMVTSLCGAEALRIRAVHETPTGESTQHGTALVIGGLVITAAHVVDIGGVFVETEAGWIRCVRVKIDADWDVAVLRPCVAVPDTAGRGTACFASIRGKDVAGLPAQDVRSKTATIKGYDHGGSGAPVYSGGKLAGMARAFEAGTATVDMVPVVILRELLEGCK